MTVPEIAGWPGGFSQLGEFALAISIRNAVICAFLMAGLVLLRNATANVRYNLICGALGVMFLAMLSPTWLDLNQWSVGSADAPSAPLAVRWSAQPGPTGELAGTAEIIPPDSWPGGWLPQAGLVWIFGVLVTLAIFGKTFWAPCFQRLAIDGPATRQVRRGLGKSRNAPLQPFVKQIVVAGNVRVPCVVGTRRGLIALPPMAANWSPLLTATVVRHEIEHLKSFDIWRSVLAVLVLSLNWFNPLVWWAAKRAFSERELACDEKVVRQMRIEPVEYFERLLTVARAMGRQASLPVPAAGSCHSLLQRADWLTLNRPAMTWPGKLAASLVLAAAFLVAPVLGWQTPDFQVVVQSECFRPAAPFSAGWPSPLAARHATAVLATLETGNPTIRLSVAVTSTAAPGVTSDPAPN